MLHRLLTVSIILLATVGYCCGQSSSGRLFLSFFVLIISHPKKQVKCCLPSIQSILGGF